MQANYSFLRLYASPDPSLLISVCLAAIIFGGTATGAVIIEGRDSPRQRKNGKRFL